MTVLHSGATKKYVEGWANVFGKKSGGGAGKAAARTTKAVGRKSAKRAVRKPARKKR